MQCILIDHQDSMSSGICGGDDRHPSKEWLNEQCMKLVEHNKVERARVKEEFKKDNPSMVSLRHYRNPTVHC